MLKWPLLFDIRHVGKLRRSAIFIVPERERTSSPIGATYSGSVPDYAAPTELKIIGGRHYYKYFAPNGAWVRHDEASQGYPRLLKANEAY